MIDDAKQEALIRYLLGETTPAESDALAQEIASSPELREFLQETENSLSAFAHAAPLREPPPELGEKIFAAIGGRTQQSRNEDSGGGGNSGGMMTAAAGNAGSADPKTIAFPGPSSGRSSASLFPWALAACLAIGCGLLAWDRVRFQGTADQLRQEVAALQNQNQISQVAIVTLKAQMQEYASSNAIILWDQKRQTGELQIAKLPVLKPDQDYQIWGFNEGNPEPIPAGLLRVANDGKARVNFRPEKPIAPKHSFALSIEPKGGRPKPEGPVVFTTQ